MQFSLATLMMAIAGCSVLFAGLRALGISAPAVLMTLLHFTTVAYAQWALFDGRSPYAASFFVGGGLQIQGFVANMPDAHPLAIILAVILAFIVGGLGGVGVAGFCDFFLLLSQSMRGVVPKPWESAKEMQQSPAGHGATPALESRRGIRLALLCVLASLFFFGMVWGRLTGQQWVIWGMYDGWHLRR